jgi:protein-S-isoprenylcysteine O-methyltransferase Ste14
MKRLAFALPVALTRGAAFRTFGVERSRPPVRRRDWAELAAKATIVFLFSTMASGLAHDFAKTGHVTGLLLVVSEALVVVLTVFRRTAGVVDRSLRARLLTIIATFGPLMIQPGGMITPWAPESLTVPLMAAGLIVVISAKASLGRSFGLTPANRGIVCSGVYGFVRHPIYLGYLISHVAFICANPLPWNVTLLAAADVALILRSRVEEETLAKDRTYREYMTRVRFRLVPGVF